MDVDNMNAHSAILEGAHRTFAVLAVVLSLSVGLWTFGAIDEAMQGVSTLILGATFGAWLTTAVRLSRLPRFTHPSFDRWSASLLVLGSLLMTVPLLFLLLAD